jgi:hypothetical protein
VCLALKRQRRRDRAVGHGLRARENSVGNKD